MEQDHSNQSKSNTAHSKVNNNRTTRPSSQSSTKASSTSFRSRTGSGSKKGRLYEGGYTSKSRQRYSQTDMSKSDRPKRLSQQLINDRKNGTGPARNLNRSNSIRVRKFGVKAEYDDQRSQRRTEERPAKRNRSDRPRKPKTAELKIQRWGINGEGIGYKNRKPVFIEGVIPDETAKVEIIEENETYSKGKLIEVLEESLRRRFPMCELSDKCGGCAFMHVDYKGQIQAKQKLLKEALKKYAGYIGPIEPIIKNPSPLAYRNACKFPFGTDEEGKISTGMYARDSHEFVPVPRCLIHSKKLEKVRHEVEEVLRKFDMKPYDSESDEGLRVLVLKEFDDKVHVVLVTSEMDLPEEMVDELLNLEDVAGVWQSIKDKDESDFELYGKKMRHLGGQMNMDLTLGDLHLELLPRSFFQLNTKQAINLYELVRSWVPEHSKTIVEAYSGIGAISLYTADKADQVIGIEYIEDAVANAKANALQNGKENVSFICGDAGEELEKIAKTQEVNTLIVDPPRSGLNKKMKEAIFQAKPEEIIYVSCNPATLGKDLKDLSPLYNIEDVQPFDMFSQTPQIETAVLLLRKSI